MSDRLGSALAARAPQHAGLQQAATWLDKVHGHDFDPRFTTEKRQKFRVVEYRLQDGGVTLVIAPYHGVEDGTFASADAR